MLAAWLVLAGATPRVCGESLTVAADRSFPADSVLTYDSVEVQSGATLTLGGGTVLTVTGDLTLATGSTVVCEGKNTSAQVDDAWAGVGVTIHADNLTVESGSAITADGQGYTHTGGGGPGAPSSILSDGTCGAAHGGAGGDASRWNDPDGKIYGSATAPVDLGSAGGAANTGGASNWTAGGGAIRLIVDGMFTLDGEISADGAGGGTVYVCYAGGSGGSVWIDADTLVGAGTITADGSGGTYAGSSGGRIAVYYRDGSSFTGFTPSSVSGGVAPTASGEDGTMIFVDTSVTDGAARVSQRMAYDEDAEISFGTLTVDDGATLKLGGGSTLEVAGALTIADNSTVVCEGKNTSAQVDGAWAGVGVTIHAGSLTVESGSVITADGQGYTHTGGGGPGAPSSILSDGSCGAAHGGAGGDASSWNDPDGEIYGSATAPVDPGSAGGAANTGGASNWTAGGGAIRLIVDGTLTLDGEISADGAGGGTYLVCYAGGSGGSVWIDADTLVGAGTITADGSGGTYAGSGGGRIAIYNRTGDALTDAQITAAGGIPSGTTAGGSGSAGTIVRDNAPAVEFTSKVATFMHGTEELAWNAFSIDQRSSTCDLLLSGTGQAAPIANDMAVDETCSWDTSLVADGGYELRLVLRDTSGTTIVETTKGIVVLNDAIWHSGTISDAETWSAGILHIVEGTLTVAAGGSLTIEAGAIVKFMEGAGISVVSGGTFIVSSTDESPTVLTSIADDDVAGDSNGDGAASSPVAGDWAGIVIASDATASISDLAEIRYVVQTYSGSLAAGVVWPGNCVYCITSDLAVPSGISLTINAGAIVKFSANAGLVVANGGTLTVDGTLAQPVVFTSIADDAFGGDTNGDGNSSAASAGDWTWLNVSGTAGLTHARIRYGGGSASGTWNQSAAVRTAAGSASLSMDACVVEDALFDGIIPADGLATITNSLLLGCSRGIVTYSGTTVVTNCTIDDCETGILNHGGTMAVENCLVSRCSSAGIALCCNGVFSSLACNDVWCPDEGAVAYSGLSELTGTSGNIAIDPGYVDADARDHRLAYASPAIDAVTDASAPEHDYFGNARYDDPRTTNTAGVADIGACEFVETATSDIDLVASAVTGPTEISAGSEVSVSWTVTNAGAEPVTGPWHDTVRLTPAASDGTGTAASTLLVGSDLTLGVGQSTTFTKTIVVPTGVEGRYRWLVQVNAVGDLFEGQNTENNTARALTASVLTVPALEVGGSVSGELATPGASVVYKLQPDVGTSVLLTLDRDGTGGVTRLAVAEEAIPTTDEADGLSMQWNEPDASVAIPRATSGVYYVAVIPVTLPSTPLAFTLSAAEVDFAVTSIEISSGSNRGRVTIPILGTRLRRDLAACLANNADSIEAESVYFADSTHVYATFDLTGATGGTYDVVVTQENASASLEGAFTITDDAPGELRTAVLLPTTVRTGRTFTVWVEYENTGHTDLESPMIGVTSSTGTTLDLSASGSFADTRLSLLAVSSDGPSWILRPGQTGRVPVYGVARSGTNQLATTVTTTASTATMDWSAIRATLRPTSDLPENWDLVWDVVVATYGDTAGDYVRWLCDACELWDLRTGERSHDPKTPMLFYLNAQLEGLTTLATGQVLSADDDSPLADVVVALTDSDDAIADATVSANDGHVGFANATAGTYTVSFDDHLPPNDLTPLVIPSDGQTTEVIWRLQAGGTLRGTVMLADGLDLTALMVCAEGTDGTVAVSELDELGRYVLRGLPTDTYSVTLLGSDIVPTSVSGVAVTAGQTTYGPTLAAQGAGAIAGTVARADDSAAVAGARVIAIGTSTSATTSVSADTGSDGSYAISGLAAGTYRLRVHADGLATASADDIEVVAGSTTSDVDVALAASGTVSGTITADGIGVASAYVTLANDDTTLASATSDSAGTYAIEGVPAGTWTLTITTAMYQSYTQDITLSAGETVQADVELAAAACVTGTVTGTSGAALAGTIVRLVAADGTVTITYTDETGSYLFGQLAAGTYVVSLADGSQAQTIVVTDETTSATATFSLVCGGLAGYAMAADGSTPVQAVVSLLADGRIVARRIATTDGLYGFSGLAPGTYDVKLATSDAFFPAVTGVVVEADTITLTDPVAAGSATLEVQVLASNTPVADGIMVLLDSGEGDLAPYDTRIALLDASGAAAFAGLVPGDYRLRAVTASAASGYVGVTVADGTTETTIAVYPAGSISGRVCDDAGSPLAGIDVEIHLPDDPDHTWSTLTDDDGAYTVSGLPPGTYAAVFAERSSEVLDTLHQPAVVSDLVVTAEMATACDPVLPAVASGISGQIADNDGSHPLHAVIVLRNSSGRIAASAGMADDGSFMLPSVPTGTYSLAARADYFTVESRSITLTDGETRDGVDLVAHWVGGADGVIAVTTATSTAVRRATSIEACTFNAGWIQQATNALSQGLREVLGAPPEAEANLPAIHWDSDCSCPAAVAKYQQAMRYQTWADTRWHAWNEQWEAAQQTTWAQAGIFGVSLMKFAVNLQVQTLKLPQEIDGLVDSTSALKKLLANPGGYSPATLARMQAALAQMESLQAAMLNLFSNTGTIYNALQSSESSGLQGNINGIFNVLSDPVAAFSTQAGLTNTAASINNFIGNLTNVVSTLNSTLGLVADLKDACPAMDKAIERLGAITDGLEAVFEAGKTVSDFTNGLTAVENAHEAYVQALLKRDHAYQQCLQLKRLCQCHSTTPEDETPPPDGDPGGSGSTTGLGSIDPNEKLTTGVGANGYVTSGSPIVYTIRFENVSTATAAAQVVTVSDPLPVELDWSTLELVGIGFNGVDLTPPTTGLQSWSTQATVSTDPNPVDVLFAFDPDTGLVELTLASIDADTGELPEDPSAGFLPPNDENGAGEGHVSFLVYPNPGLADGATIENTAVIVFDVNDPITTNTAVNTLDATPPTVTVEPLSEESPSTFTLSWTGSDSGSGIARYEIYVSVDGGAFSLYADDITTTSITYSGESGHTYAFWVRAIDALGQSVACVPTAATSTTIAAATSVLANFSGRGNCGSGDAIMIIGFVLEAGASPTATKPLLIRGVGHQLGLAPWNMSGTLSDPQLRVFDATGQAILANDDWSEAADPDLLSSEAARLGAFALDEDSPDSVVLSEFTAGLYTVHVAGHDGSTGIALVEAYDAAANETSRPRVLNFSVRGQVGTGDEVLIAGFVISGSSSKQVLVRGVGATLGLPSFGVNGALADARLRLHDATGTAVAENDDWAGESTIAAAAQRVGAFDLSPDSTDAALLVTLAPGAYTVVCSGADAGTGIALIELYDADSD